MKFAIVDNPTWWRGGMYALQQDGVTVLTNDNKAVLAHYAGLLGAEASSGGTNRKQYTTTVRELQ